MWAHPELPKLPRLHQIVVRILTHMSDAPALPAGQAPAAAPAARAAVNPATVQQIVDMGFPAIRAEQALRRVSFCLSHGCIR